MLFILKFNRQLFAAAKPTVISIQRGDEVGAMRSAAGMSRAVAPPEAQAMRKAGNAMIDGNDGLYASMALRARQVGEAGKLIASADRGDGTLVRVLYQREVRLLDSALSGS